MLKKRCDGGFCGAAGLDPTGAQAAEQADAVEHFDLRPAFDDKSFDDVEAVQFGTLFPHVGQIPPLWRGRASNAMVTVQRAAAFENSPDGSHRGDPVDAQLLATLHQFSVNGGGAELAEIAGVAQMATELDHVVFDLGGGGLRLTPSAARPGPIDTVQPPMALMGHPALYRAQADATAHCHCSHGPSLSYLCDHLPPTLFNRLFRSRFGSPCKNFFAPMVTPFG